MSEMLFLQALRDVGAGESKWPLSTPYALGCKFGNGIKLIVFNDGHVCFEDLVAWRYALRKPDGNLTEAVRYAENLRRALAGEPSLEVERLQKALEQASESMWIETMGEDQQVESNTYNGWRYRGEDMILAHAGNGYAIIGRAEDNPELAAELKRRAGEVQE